jgi:hypothetical protein
MPEPRILDLVVPVMFKFFGYSPLSNPWQYLQELSFLDPAPVKPKQNWGCWFSLISI